MWVYYVPAMTNAAHFALHNKNINRAINSQKELLNNDTNTKKEIQK